MDEPLFNELLESVKQADQIMTDHAELRRLAEAATPGEWRTGDGDDSLPDCVLSGEFVVCEHAGGDVDYIAAANPKTVLALLDEIDRLKAENEALRKIISECATACGAGCAPECTLEFMSMLPGEISSVVSRRAAAEIGKSMGGGE